MLNKSINIVSCLVLLMILNGCSTTTHDPVYREIYKYDRTLSLKDIAPIIPAYVDRPYPLCERSELVSRDDVQSTINTPVTKRVYVVGGKKCVVSL